MSSAVVKPTSCGICGRPIVQKRTGRPRKWCETCVPLVQRAQIDGWDDTHRPGRRKQAALKQRNEEDACPSMR